MAGYFDGLGPVCEEKWAKLGRELAAANVVALVANDLPTVRYLTGYLPYLVLAPGLGQLSVYVAGRGAPILYPRAPYVRFAQRQCPWLDVRTPKPGAPEVAAEVAAVLRGAGASGGRVACTGLTPDLDAALRASLGGDAIVDGVGLMQRARAVKTPGEVALLRESVGVAEIGMREALAALAVGRSECEVAAEAERAMRRHGTESHAIAVRGAHAAILQEISTDDIFVEGDFAMVDLGCYRRGYRAEYARSRVVGRPPRADEREMFDVVARAVAAAGALLKPETTCGAVARRAEEVIRDAGYGDHVQPHAVGHGLGVTGLEYPIVTPASEVPLEANMVINLEPGIFIPERAVGLRIEEIWLVTADGPELLTRAVPRVG